MQRLVGLVLGITAVIVLMLLAFATPALHSGAHELPLAVSGPAPAVAQLTGMLEAQSPGTFATTIHASAEESAAAIRDRAAIGGLALGPTGVMVQTAAGAGAPYAALLKGVGAQLAATGQTVTYEELAPLPAGDPAGVGLTALGLPLIFGGMAGAAALALRARASATARIVTAVALSALAGVAATGILAWLGALDGAFWPVATAVAAGIAAICLTVLGLGLATGPVGIGIGAVVLLFVANPLSGLATGPAWLPQPWGAIGQYLPVGAAGTAIRSAAYFDGGGSGTAYLVLGAWILVGLLLCLAGSRRIRTSATAQPAAA